MPSPGVPHKFQRYAPLVIGGVLLALFATLLAWQVSEWLQLTQTPVQRDDTPPPAVAEPPQPERLELLFGTPPGGFESAEPLAEGLGLILHGSIVTADPKRSSAIIQAEGDSPRLYRPGDEISDGLRLQGVYPDRIELIRDGRAQTLRFPETTGTDYAPPMPDYAPDVSPDMQPSELPDEPSIQELQDQMDTLRQELEQPSAVPPDEQPTENN